MTNPTVSILIPVYNVEPFLRQCLDSVVHQSYRSLQVVIVDDGSTDGSPDLCLEYSARYDFVEYYRKDNGGVASSRNMLLDKAIGEYSLFVDADDWIDADMVEGLMYLIRIYALDVAVCGNYKEVGGTTIYNSNSGDIEILSQEEAIKQFIIHKRLNGSLWNKLIRTELFGKHRFDPDISYGEDALMMWYVLQDVKRIGIIDKPYYHYRMNDASISHQTFGPKKMSGHKVWERIASDTHSLWPQYGRLADVSYAVSDMWLLFYAAQSDYPKDENIQLYQRHVRRNLLKLASSWQVSLTKTVFAAIACSSYRLSKIVIKRFF